MNPLGNAQNNDSPKLAALEDENVEMANLENGEALGFESYARPEVGANEDVPNCIHKNCAEIQFET